MTKLAQIRLLLVLSGFLSMGLWGCGKPSPPVIFYNLETMATPSPASALGHAPTLVVGVGPVTFPESLNRAQIANRIDGKSLRFNEFHRWSGSLADDFSRVLLEDLASCLPSSSQLASHPWGKYYHPTHRVLIYVRQFDGSLGGEVILEARWDVTDGEGKKLLSSTKSVIHTPVPGTEFQDMVSAQSETVAKLAMEIATSLLGQ